MDDADQQRAAYAVDSAAVELTWVSGPPLVLLAGTLLSTAAALVVAGAVLTVSTALFAATRASRAWRPEPAEAATASGALRSAGVRTLVLALGSAGLLFGATEVAVTATADALGGTAAAGPLLGLWGVGSLIGGVVVARAGGGARTGAGLAALLATLAATHLALAAATGSVLALGAVIVVAGSMIAPTCATAYAMVDAAAPAGTTTEAFAWLATAVAIGTSAGAALAGAVADASGPAPTFVLAGTAAAIGAAVTLLRAGAASRPPPPPWPARPDRDAAAVHDRLRAPAPARAGQRAAARRRGAADRRPLPRPVAPARDVEDPALGAARRPRHRLRAPPRARDAARHPLVLQEQARGRGREQFRAHVEETAAAELDALAAELDHAPPTALMCLEAEPAVCHRRVLAEQLRKRRPDLDVVDL